MAYQRGIPIIYPAEIITKDMILYVTKLKVAKLHIVGTEDPELEYIKVIQQ
jgi:arginine decarboxylase